MSNRVEPLQKDHSFLTRREFTLETALALLAGCAIMISDEACGGNSTSPSDSAPPTDVTGSISANHNHSAMITGAQITAANAIVLNIQGTAAHAHTVSISQADLMQLKNRQSVERDSTTDLSNTFGLHSHMVTFTPA